MATNYKFKKVKAGRDHIADNFHNALSLSDMAQHAHISPYHFLRVFKDTYGETPNEFLIRLRVAHAKKLLITENHSVSEICEHVGYSSLGSFSSLFLKQTGMAPTLYRRKLWALSAEPFCFPAQAIPACYARHFLGK
ncbi:MULTISPECIES: AraC family transcriptional regulator [Pseudoalteromonas]|uniref:Helix-turn-helix domain-containing protein n=1 Tax=Pseudoalteromonas rubra TaxID=43658 RepID=A0A5S3US16_9GAMM|nr:MULTISPECIES: AraC family transcriptional regulator [Pseudoalteromonas]MCG7561226.1 AraC family transcriptional regulator [Pseudoalteromonas sp. McH1-42]QPB85566.1 helix-turn-helix domain-containing protein [Pseudoalteromonas rubra]